MLVEGLLKKAQLEPYTNAGKPAASGMAYRVIWVTDLAQLQVSDGSTWQAILTTAANSFAVAYPIIIGSAAQVTAGAATHSTFASAIAAATSGNAVKVLEGSWTENVSCAKKLYFEGSGHGSLITGTWTWASGSSKASLSGVKLTDNMTINSGITGLWVERIWFAATKTFTDNSTQNANFLMANQE